MKRLNNPFVVFQGGGYDGCFWEWNVIAFRENKPDPDLSLVSGRTGKEWMREAQQSPFRAVRGMMEDTREAMLVRTEDQWDEFCAAYNAGFVRTVARKLDQSLICYRCKCHVSADEAFADGYKGDGGIGVVYDEMFCWECLSIRADEYFAESGWKWSGVADRVEFIQEHNRQNHYPKNDFGPNSGYVSPFAARHDECPPIETPESYRSEMY